MANAYHWADQAASRVMATCGDKEQYVVASGITPSGDVHIGNFREVITVDFVARALRSAGKQVKFIYSWDDFDTFRKVPVGLPAQDMLKEQLGRPISRIPDPYGETESYAKHNIEAFENDLQHMGISPEFQYQQERYSQGVYAQGIRTALEKKDKIVDILNEYRSAPLPDSWLPTAIYCSQCGRDKMTSQSYDGDWSYSYDCSSCGHKETVDIRESKNLKLGWRIDWPMRWAHYQVDFEPGGKDHSSDGGSFATGKRIVKDVYDRAAPVYVQYDFVSIKGGPGKMSSSKGGAIKLGKVMDIYSPEMIRYIFAKQKPNTDFAIAFDEDVIKLHEEFDRAEAMALEKVENPNAKWLTNRRVYELSLVNEGEVPEKLPARAGFRMLSNRLQICDGDIDRTFERYYKNEIIDALDIERFRERAKRAWNWIVEYASEDFRYQIHKKPVDLLLSEGQKSAVAALRQLIESTDLDAIAPKDLNQAIFDEVVHKTGVDAKEVFHAVYCKLIGREQGPRLPGFLKEIGKERLLALL